jgi:alkanesulfonate monooxygenase SsuD/methylene tetrahydromethanopterin reductase-like flavin-dependent oxidoreductase (luciferase family)
MLNVVGYLTEITQGVSVGFEIGEIKISGGYVRLGLNLGYQAAWTTPADHLALAREADRLGYSVVWAAEAYGSDSPTMLAWIAGQTERIDIGAAVMQIPARSPAMTAMTAATIDALSGGRFRLGLGVSGPQVSEGWHGVRFATPLGRTREYVDLVNLASAWPRSARRTWSWPARSPTAGWPSSSRPTPRGSTSSTSSAAGPRPAPGCPVSTWRPVFPWCSATTWRPAPT